MAQCWPSVLVATLAHGILIQGAHFSQHWHSFFKPQISFRVTNLCLLCLHLLEPTFDIKPAIYCIQVSADFIFSCVGSISQTWLLHLESLNISMHIQILCWWQWWYCIQFQDEELFDLFEIKGARRECWKKDFSIIFYLQKIKLPSTRKILCSRFFEIWYLWAISFYANFKVGNSYPLWIYLLGQLKNLWSLLGRRQKAE